MSRKDPASTLPMTVVFDRPYEFVPPLKSKIPPWVIQKLRLFDRYLRKAEGVFDYELRDLHHLQSSVDDGHGILLAPNHCRYADPLIMGWPARKVGVDVYAMASWHLFNSSWFEKFALRCMGAFSIFREGNDRQSLEAAISILTEGERPLVVFPEGTTNRTNDQLKPLLDGVAFMARSAAKRRAKWMADPAKKSAAASGKVVIHPVGIKYLCIGKIDQWATKQLDAFERQLGWTHMPARDIRTRTVQLAEALLALKETQYRGGSGCGELPKRRDDLIQFLLDSTEERMGLDQSSEDVRERVRLIRSTSSSRFFDDDANRPSIHELQRDVMAADWAQDLASYPDSYLTEGQATDTRIVETIQRMQESVNGKADHSMPLKAVIQIGSAIEVDTKRPRRGERDPLMVSLENQLTGMVDQMATEANLL